MFEIKLVGILGYQPHFNECVVCEAPGEHDYIDFNLGGLVCRSCRPQLPPEQGMNILPGTVKSLRFLRDSFPSKAARLKVPPSIKEEMKRFIRKYMVYNMPGGEVNERFYEQITR